jgi:hypothetical protein
VREEVRVEKVMRSEQWPSLIITNRFSTSYSRIHDGIKRVRRGFEE